MKRVKAIASMVLALVMVIAMAVPAMAATVTVSGAHAEGHTYDVYQIFVGDVYTTNEGGVEKEVFSNVKYGVSYGKAGDSVDPTVLEGLNTADNAQQFAKDLVESGDLKDVYVSLPKDGSYTMNDVPQGYYLIVDTTESIGQADAASAYIVQVIGENVTIAPKADVPSLEKKVKEKNDSTNVESGWQDAADYDLDDHVPFQLNATLPGDVTNFGFYKTYGITFHDEMDPGFTFDNNVVVKVGGVAIDSKYYSVVTETGDDCDFHVVISDVKAIEGVDIAAGTVISVEYTAQLTGDDVVIGEVGNLNKAYLQYSNDPYDTTTSTTPKDTVKVFSFDGVVNKVDDSHDPLKGAEFTLYKWEVGTAGGDITTGDYDAPDGVEAAGYWKAISVKSKNTDGTEFTFKGLDSGIYKLVESHTPDGYNTADPVDFVITSEYDANSADPQLTKLEVTGGFSAEKTAGTVTTDIVNKAGTTLPETGGIGTTIFYVAGAILVIGAGVLLITKKRMKNE